jgi:hypothetical protein
LVTAIRANFNNQIYSNMRNLVKNSENILLTVVTLCAMYFLGSMLVHLFQSVILPHLSLWQDETLRNFSLAGIGAITLKDTKGAEEAKKKAVPFTVSEGLTKNEKPAYILHFAIQSDMYNFLDLGKVAGIKAFRWYSKDVKEGANVSFAVGAMKEAYSEQFINHYHKMTFKNAQELKAQNSEVKAKEREQAKEAKKASKGTAKVGNVGSIIAAKIQAYKDLFAEGTITSEQMLAAIDKLTV